MERILRVYISDKHTIVYELTEMFDNGDVHTHKKESPLGEDLINFIDNDYNVCKTIADCTSPEDINPLLWVLYRNKEYITETQIKENEEIRCGLKEFFSSLERNEISKEDCGFVLYDFNITVIPIKGGFNVSCIIEPEDIMGIVSFTLYELFRNGFRLMRCKLCDKLYINNGKADYVYCHRLCEDGVHSCRQIGSSIVFKQARHADPVSRVLDKFYKRYYSRKSRGSLSDEDFKAWSKEASSKLAAYKDGKYSGEELVDWLNKVAPSGRGG